MSSPLFSVITPSFNQANFIRSTIESVLSQRVDLEHIVIDGGSSDGTVEILDEYAIRFPDRFRFVSEHDNGQSDAINKGMRMARGRILSFLNSDDEYLPGALETIEQAVQQNPQATWFSGKCVIVDQFGVPIRSWFSAVKDLIAPPIRRNKLLAMNIISQPSTFWLRSVYERYGEFRTDMHLAMDYEFWCRISREPVAYVPQPISRYRFYLEAKSGSSFVRQYWDEFKIAREYARGFEYAAIAIHLMHFGTIVTLFWILRHLKR